MATFPSITPTYGAQKSSKPTIRTTQFGDGYQQRVTFGLNQNPKQWDLTWNVSETDADTIEAFLDARAADAASFDWTPIDESTAYKWICLQWSKSIPYVNRATITATFQQVFEP
jgi:phage-related protein